MAATRGYAVVHPDGTVCVHSVHVGVVGAIVDWAAAHGMVIRQMPDEEVWAIWERERVASFGTSTLACVAIEPIEGGTVHSLSGIPGN